MNLTSDNADRNPFSQLKTRYVVALGGFVLAVGMALGGAGALKLNSATSSPAVSAPHGATTQTLQPMFATAADAEFAARSLVVGPAPPSPAALQPMFGTAADAENAAQSLR